MGLGLMTFGCLCLLVSYAAGVMWLRCLVRRINVLEFRIQELEAGDDTEEF